ncbi:MAG: TetR/AcrR family transcriptional regulator [Paracoccaceae bacterium]|jgi:AcrR family transcriptional regulator|nr:TetR/AcrR family transcriptional regulator [Paracoccaceae bacterium]
MNAVDSLLKQDVPGVFEARQSRSVKNRDGFLKAAIDALNTMPFDDIKISELAVASGNSVGSFYTRFQDKDALLRALTIHAIDVIDSEISAGFTSQKLQNMPAAEGLDALVDVLGDIFASRFRGVLRENYTRISDRADPWGPMRTSAQRLLGILHEGLGSAFPQYGPDETRTRLSFCFQIIVGVLQNDLVNNYHVFKLEDGTVLTGLKETLRAYMGLPVTPGGG